MFIVFYKYKDILEMVSLCRNSTAKRSFPCIGISVSYRREDLAYSRRTVSEWITALCADDISIKKERRKTDPEHARHAPGKARKALQTDSLAALQAHRSGMEYANSRNKFF